MIERYSLPDMAKIWTLENKYKLWLEVELAVCEAQKELGKIPEADFENIKANAKIDVREILNIENEVKHDVIAFLTNLNNNVGASSRYIHMGLTSSDVVDTALSLQLKEASTIIEKDLKGLIQALKNKAIEHKNTVCIGRSHGIFAEPMTFGIKVCNFLDMFERGLKRFQTAKKEIALAQLSGAVGTYSNIEPEVERLTAEKLGLKPAKISSQIIARDNHANYLQTLANIASCIEHVAVELRHLQRSEVLEVEEDFGIGQKGSSAMPHKRNPISGENLTGLARVVRANSMVALENIPLWHERDISHSSAERIILPDSTILVDYMINRLTKLMKNLKVYPERMLQNMNSKGGVIYSQRVLLALTGKGLLREEAYKLVQSNAFSAWESPNGDFKANLHKNIPQYLTANEIEECFSSDYYLRNIAKIYERFGV